MMDGNGDGVASKAEVSAFMNQMMGMMGKSGASSPRGGGPAGMPGGMGGAGMGGRRGLSNAAIGALAVGGTVMVIGASAAAFGDIGATIGNVGAFAYVMLRIDCMSPLVLMQLFKLSLN